MDLDKFDGKCVRIITSWGEVFEGVASYDDREYAFHEYGHDEEALCLVPIIFYKNDISSVISLEGVNGPFGHYSEKYGLLEKKCLEWGTDMIEEVFDSEDDSRILRMLDCMKDNFQTLASRAVPGIAPWRSGISASGSEDDETEMGPVYLGELERMLSTLVKYNDNKEVVNEAKGLLEKLSIPEAMTEFELKKNLKARITPEEASILRRDEPDLCISAFNREACLRLLDDERPDGRAVCTEKVTTLEGDLKNYLGEYMRDKPEGHKWIIIACLYLTFIEHLPMHPQKAAGWIEKDGKYYCPSMEPESITCRCCMCEKATTPVSECSQAQPRK